MRRLQIDGRYDDAGRVRATWLLEDGGAWALLDETQAVGPDAARPQPLPAAAVLGAFARYGRSLDGEPVGATNPTTSDDSDDQDAIPLVLPSGATAQIRALRFRGWGSVEPSDWLVLESGELVAAPAKLVAAALRALARAVAR